MITPNPFSFISYNSSDFLRNVLQNSVECGDFSRCACWYHESVGSEKNHFHCWIEPNKKIDTTTLQPRFNEIDEEGSPQSIAIKPKCSSKFNDAYLYGIHDRDYLDSKGKVRELVNIVSDKHIYIGDFNVDIQEAEIYKFKSVLTPYQRLKSLVYQGLSLEDVYIRLRTPFAQMRTVGSMYNVISKDYDRFLLNQEVLKHQEEEEQKEILLKDYYDNYEED